MARHVDGFRLDLGPGTPAVASGLTFAAGLVLLVAAMLPTGGPGGGAATGTWTAADVAYGLQVAGGVALLVLARGVGQRLEDAWRCSLGFALLGLAVAAVVGEPIVLKLALALVALALFACRRDFLSATPAGGEQAFWRSPPVWLIALVAATLASGMWLLGRV